MNTKSMLDCENDRLRALRVFQLPHAAKRIGIFLALAAFVLLFVNAFLIEKELIRSMARYGLLIGMLIISISKEPIEDERIMSIRMRSYAFAFVAGVAFSLVQPFFDVGVDLLVNPEKAALKDSGDFVILWLLLSIQVFSFHLSKS